MMDPIDTTTHPPFRRKERIKPSSYAVMAIAIHHAIRGDASMLERLEQEIKAMPIKATAKMTFGAELELNYEQVLILASALRTDRARLARTMGAGMNPAEIAVLEKMLDEWQLNLETCINKFSAAERAFDQAHYKERK